MMGINIAEKLDALAVKKYILERKKADFDEVNKDLIDEIAMIESEIKEAVLAKGETVRTERIQAVWNKGKTTWDGGLLEGYAVAHPEILAAKKTGKPTVSFRLQIGRAHV